MTTLQYVKPNEEQKILMQLFRDKYEYLYQQIQAVPKSRGQSLALIKLEESAMWLNKALTDND